MNVGRAPVARSRRERSARYRRPALKLAVAIAGAVVAGELAVWLLRPAVGLHPREVNETAYFSSAQLSRIDDFTATQRLLGIGGLLAQGGLLVVLVIWPPRRSLAAITRLSRRRTVAAAATGVALLIAVTAVGLPFAAVAHRRELDFDLSGQGWSGWASDVAKTVAIGSAMAAALAPLALALIRRLGRCWWIAGAGAVVALEIAFVWLAPVLLAPLFNRYRELPRGPTRTDLVALARREGIKVDKVLVVDASRQTNTVNAYVTGIGATKRIVLYDNLLARYTPAEVRLVVAHELGHVAQHDIWRGIAWTALFAPGGVLLVALLAGRWSRRAGVEPGSPGSLPAIALAFVVVSSIGMLISNQLSRRVEARADEIALESTGEGLAAAKLEQRLVVSNLSDPSPPGVLHFLMGTHPTPIERIGAALAFEQQRREPESR